MIKPVSLYLKDFKTAMHAFLTTQLDYCNALYIGLSQSYHWSRTLLLIIFILLGLGCRIPATGGPAFQISAYLCSWARYLTNIGKVLMVERGPGKSAILTQSSVNQYRQCKSPEFNSLGFENNTKFAVDLVFRVIGRVSFYALGCQLAVPS